MNAGTPLLSLPAVLVEAFAAGPCCGNGAAVVLLEQPLADASLQAIARSLNQSETAFLLQQSGRWCLRWFTPSCEVPLCGHATLAALIALGHWQRLTPGDELPLHSRSGALPVQLDPSGAADLPQSGSLVLPSTGIRPAEPSPSLIRLLTSHLGLAPLAYWTSDLGYRVALLPAQAPLSAMPGLAAELEGPDRAGLVLMQAFKSAPRPQRPEVMGQAADYQLRFFAPGLGIDEDPVTGSAHALVAPYWMEQLNRCSVVGWQCSPRPGGLILSRGAGLDRGLSSAMIRLHGTGHLLWTGTLRVCDDDSDQGSWASLLTCV